MTNVRLHADGDDLRGRLMCYHCYHSFPVPKNATARYVRVKCKNCGWSHERDQYKTAPDDPLRHPLGWPYDDPTVRFDC